MLVAIGVNAEGYREILGVAESSREDKEAARQKAAFVAEKLRGMKLDSVAKFVEDSVEETLPYMDFFQ